MSIIFKYFQSIRKRVRKKVISNSVKSIFDIDVPESRKYPIKKEIISTPEVLNMQFLPDARYLQMDSYETPEIFTTVLKNVLFCPRYNLILTESRQVIKEGLSTIFGGNIDLKFLKNADVKNISGCCSIFRSSHNPYYHTIIDNLPRIFLLKKNEYEGIKEIKLLCSDPVKGFEQYYLNKLLPFNVKLKTLDKNYIYRIEEMIFPSFLTKRFSGFLPGIYLDYFLKEVLPNRDRQSNKRIFISRISSNRGMVRCIKNEDYLFKELKDFGFKRYVLEKMSIEEQIDLFYDAEIIIGPHGAGFTNLIFSGRINVIELFPSKFVVPHYYYLTKSLNQKYSYWCGKEKDRDNNFNVDITAVMALVNEVLKSK